MIIHLTSSRKKVINSIQTMRKVIRVVHELGHVISRDWVEPFYAMNAKGVEGLPPEEIFKLNIDAIERADLVIVEGSDFGFGAGFQIATALQKKKPTLLLVSNESQTTESPMSQGANDPLLTRKVYTDVELDKIVRQFIEENTISTKDLRFNFVIDRQIYNHLRFRSYKTGKTKAEILRDLLLRDIEDSK